MYTLLMLAATLGATDPQLEAEKGWYLSRKMYETQVRRGMGPKDYYEAKKNLEKMSPQDQRAFIGAERLRSENLRRCHEAFMEGQRMRIERTRALLKIPPRVWKNPYPQMHFGPNYRKPNYAYPYHSPYRYNIWLY
jgi:hypothetical protein